MVKFKSLALVDCNKVDALIVAALNGTTVNTIGPLFQEAM